MAVLNRPYCAWRGAYLFSPGGAVSRSLNKVMLIGNVGNDPEVRATPNGARVAQFNLATTRTWNGQGGDKQEKTEWHRCVLWNGRASGGGLRSEERRVGKEWGARWAAGRRRQ